MTDMSQRGIHSADAGAVHARRCADQDDRNPKSTCGREFAVSRCTAAVLGDDAVDGMRYEQRPLGRLIERAPGLDVARIRQAQRRLDRVYRPNEIPMLGRLAQSRQSMTADGDEDALRRVAECLDRSIRALDFSPPIPRHRGPRSPAHGQDRRPCYPRGFDSMLGHIDGERMSRVDEQSNALGVQVVHQALDAAKAAVTTGDGLLERLARTARERQCHREIPPAGKTLRQQARFGGSSQDQGVRYVVR